MRSPLRVGLSAFPLHTVYALLRFLDDAVELAGRVGVGTDDHRLAFDPAYVEGFVEGCLRESAWMIRMRNYYLPGPLG